MATCCLCFFQGSKTWMTIAFLVPILFFATLISSSQYGASASSLIVLLIMSLSTLFLFTIFSKQKPIFIVDSSLNEQENTCPDYCSSTDDKLRQVHLVLAHQTEIADSAPQDSCNNNNKNNNIVDHQYYSTSSSTSSSEDDDQDDEDQYSSSDHSTAAEWPNHYNRTMMGQKTLDYCSEDDDSISDEESLFEIAIPSGRHFVNSPQKDHHYHHMSSCNNNTKCCKVLSADRHFPMFHRKDFQLADMSDMNEEDNLIEIDIYMGSIKCSSF